MNYLAHVFLSHDTAEAISGAMLGDFVKGRASERFSPAVQHAILLHRAIDRYTDQHDIVRASRGRMSVERRRFSGILIDVFYDHFLARHWGRYHARPLPEFTGQVYRTLLAQQAQFPERLQRMLPWMTGGDWLASYAEVGSIDAALNGIARRFRTPAKASTLKTAVQELERNYASLERDFLAFFPALQTFVASHAALAELKKNGPSRGRLGP